MQALRSHKQDKTNQTKTSCRIEYIDVARGIAILLVVIGHLTSMSQGIGQWIFSFHMPIFFFMSGILLFHNNAWKTNSVKITIVKKAKSLLYPYITFSFLSLIFILIKDGIESAKINFLRTIIFEGIAPLWFLPALFIAEMTFIIITKTIPQKCIPFVIALLVIVTILFDFANYQLIDTLPIFNPFRLANILNRALLGCIFIFIGYAYAYCKSKIKQHTIIALFSAIIALGLNIFLFRYNYIDLRCSVIGNPFIYYLNAFLGSYAIINISEILLKQTKILSFYGRNSIIIFATHLNFELTTLASAITSNHWIESFFIVLIIETPLILFINKYGKFLIYFNELKKLFVK